MSVHIPAYPETAPRGADEPPPTLALPRLLGHGCFVCGTGNPEGLKMTFARRADRVVGTVTLRQAHMGWDRIAHGGVVSALLDEVMAWTVIALERVFFVTRSMHVTYRRPAPLEVPLVGEGWIADRDPPHGCRTHASLMDGDGQLLAEAEGEMAYLPEDRLPMVSAPLRLEMLELFEAMARVDREFAR